MRISPRPRRRAPTLAYCGDSGRRRRCSRTSRATPTCSCARRPSSRATTTRRTCTSPAPRPGDTAAECRVKRLLLTHIPPWHDPQGCWPRRSGRTTARRGPRRRRARSTTSERPGGACRVAEWLDAFRHDGRHDHDRERDQALRTASRAVDDISFVAQPGRVTGFLGPNGAGKSTSMRVMVGLTPSDRGRALIGGHRYADIPNPSRHVGVLLDASAQHGGRTGREVLRSARETMGLPSSRGSRRCSSSSGCPAPRPSGGCATTRSACASGSASPTRCMGDPSVLILDEPVNGLDPAGIHWMRGLLRTFAARGGTVLLSSHLLHEVEMIADEMVLIGRGRIVAQGTKAELLAGRTARRRPRERPRTPALCTRLAAARPSRRRRRATVASGDRADRGGRARRAARPGSC